MKTAPSKIKLHLLKKADKEKDADTAKHIKDNVEALALAVWETIKNTDSKIKGSFCSIWIDEKTPLLAQYCLIEAATIIPSHVADQKAIKFRKNKKYPKGLQERRYHIDIQETDKVHKNARSFRPEYVINTNPDAITGPPIIDEKKIVLGGNSRAMTMQLIYSSGKGDIIKTALKEECGFYSCYGLTSEDITSLDEPILVRMLAFSANKDFKQAKRLVNDFNKTTTFDLDFSASVIALSSSIDRNNWMDLAKTLADSKDPNETMNSYLSTPKSLIFLRKLYSLKVITDATISSLTITNGPQEGLLNRRGRDLISELFLVDIIKDTHLLDYLKPREAALINMVAPYVIISSCCHPDFDITSDFQKAINGFTFKNPNTDALEQLQQSSFFDLGPIEEVKKSKRTRLLYHAISLNKPRKMSTALKKYADIAAKQNPKQVEMSETHKLDPGKALMVSFDAKPSPNSPSGYNFK